MDFFYQKIGFTPFFGLFPENQVSGSRKSIFENEWHISDKNKFLILRTRHFYGHFPLIVFSFIFLRSYLHIFCFRKLLSSGALNSDSSLRFRLSYRNKFLWELIIMKKTKSKRQKFISSPVNDALST